MCGIVGYVGKRNAQSILIEGLKRLEYRGYDSAGIAFLMESAAIPVYKEKGKIAELEKELPRTPVDATIGIAHTRWATHGAPSKKNAHPHLDATGTIAVAHNGIIENYREIKQLLHNDGITFKSETDTEVLPNLIAKYYEGSLECAVQRALQEVEGTFGLAIISSREPNALIAARRGAPLVVGVGNDETLIASDVSAMVAHTRNVIYLEDDEMVVVTREGYETKTIQAAEVDKKVYQIDWDLEQIEKGGYEHFMLKEIFEQPETIRNAFRGRILEDEAEVKLGGFSLSDQEFQNVKRVLILACGSSYYAGLVGERLIEDLAHIPVEVEYASEFRYRNPIIEEGTLAFAISQSGETADTLAALREAKRRGATVFGITNVVGSTIARETGGGVYIHAGPEIGVASTKAFTSQVACLALIAVSFGRRRHLSLERGREFLRAVTALPEKIETALSCHEKIKAIAEKYFNYNNALYLGRGYNYLVALEGALKLKEISYIHAEGYPAAEMKHGPIALIDENMPVVVIATRSSILEKVVSNMQEVRARGGRVIAIATEGDDTIEEFCDDIVYLPEAPDELSPILNIIPLQLLAYYIAAKRGCEIDQPRNLAKSVTVE